MQRSWTTGRKAALTERRHLSARQKTTSETDHMKKQSSLKRKHFFLLSILMWWSRRDNSARFLFVTFPFFSNLNNFPIFLLLFFFNPKCIRRARCQQGCFTSTLCQVTPPSLHQMRRASEQAQAELIHTHTHNCPVPQLFNSACSICSLPASVLHLHF